MENKTSKQIILFATENAHKVQEVRNLLSDFPFEIQTLTDYPEIIMPPEDAETFEGNALIKARYVSEITKHLVVADDSGLEVDALLGAWCSFKRYSEEQTDDANNKKLLRRTPRCIKSVLDLSVPLLL